MVDILSLDQLLDLNSQEEEEEEIVPQTAPPRMQSLDEIIAERQAPEVEEEVFTPPPVEAEPAPVEVDPQSSPFTSSIMGGGAAGMQQTSEYTPEPETDEPSYREGRGEALKGALYNNAGGIASAVQRPFQKFWGRVHGVDADEVGISMDIPTQFGSREVNLTELADESFARGAEANRIAQGTTPENAVGAFLTHVLDGAAAMGPSVIATYMTKNPNLGLSIMGAQVYGAEYGAALEEGKSPDEARTAANLAVLYELGPEKAVNFYGNIGLGSSAKDIFTQALREAPSETATSALQLADDKWREGIDIGTATDVLKTLAYDTAVGFGVGGTVATADIGPRAVRERATERAQKKLMEEALFSKEIPEDLARQEAISRLDPYQDIKDQPTPDPSIDKPVTSGRVTIPMDVSLEEDITYTAPRSASLAEAANEPTVFDNELDEIGVLAQELITGKLTGQAREDALAKIDAFKEAAIGSLQNVIDISDRLPREPQQEEAPATEPTPLYRGLKEGGTKRSQYKGSFYTEDAELAAEYARTSDSEGTMETLEDTPTAPFDVDEVGTWDQAERDALYSEFVEFSNERGIPPEDGYLHDVLKGSEDLGGERATDFVYPTEDDVDFLRSKGYDSARFENEGGQTVKSWFIFEEQTPQAEGPSDSPLTTYEVEETDTTTSVYPTREDGSVAGEITGRISSDGQTVAVLQSALDEDLRGSGNGKELYKKFIEEQERRGRSVTSDYSVTPSALGVWESLKKEGYDVEINPTLKPYESGGRTLYYETTDGNPPVVLRSSQAQEGAQNDNPISGEEVKATLPERAQNDKRRNYYIDNSNVSANHFDISWSGNGMSKKYGHVRVLPDGTTVDLAGREMREERASLRQAATEDAVRYLYDGMASENNRALDTIIDNDGNLNDGRLFGPKESLEEDVTYLLNAVDNIDPARASELGLTEAEIAEASEIANEWVSKAEKRLVERTRQDEKNTSGASTVPLPKYLIEHAVAHMEKLKAAREAQPAPEAETAVAPTEAQSSADIIPMPDRDATELSEEQGVISLVGGIDTSGVAANDAAPQAAEPAPTGPESTEGLVDQTSGISTGGGGGGGRWGGLTSRQMLSSSNQIKSLAATGKYGEEILSADLSQGIKLETKKSRGGKQVAAIELDDGSKRQLTQEEVKQQVLASRYSLSGKVKAWIDQKFNSKLQKSKQFVDQTTRKVIMESSALMSAVQVKTNYLQEAWRMKHGENIQSAPTAKRAALHAYLTGNMSRGEAAAIVNMNDAFFDRLDALRGTVDNLTITMREGNMVEGALQEIFADNEGSYLRVSYALKDLDAQKLSAAELWERIPEENRNEVSAALRQAYIDPLFLNNHKAMTKPQMYRMAKLYGLVNQKTTKKKDPDTGKETTVEADVLVGTGKTLESMSAEELYASLREMITEQQVMPREVLLSFLQGGKSSGGASLAGREKAVERRRMLARSEEQLKEAGYSDTEIKFNTAVRAMLAEHQDPITTVQQTILAMMKTISSHRIVNSIADMQAVGLASYRVAGPEATQTLVTDGDMWADIRVVDRETGETFPATKLYVTPEVRDAFERLVKPNFVSSPLLNAFRTVQGWTKVNLTAGNVGSHPRNTRSAAELVAWRGYAINDPVSIVKSINTALRLGARDSAYGFRGDVKTDQDAAINYLISLGIFHDSIRTGALKDMLMRVASSDNLIDAFDQPTLNAIDGRSVEELLATRGAIKDKIQAATRKVDPHVVEGTKKALIDGPLSLYRLEDEAFKVVMFMQEREIIADMMGRDDLIEAMNSRLPTDKEREEIKAIDRKAAYKVRNLLPTYSKVPEFWKDMSANALLVPFPSFNLEVIRNNYFDLRDMAAMSNYVAQGDKADKYGASFYHGMDKAKVAKRATERLVSWMGMSVYTAGQMASISAAYAILAAGAQPDDDDEVTELANDLTRRMESLGYTPSRTELDVYDPFVRSYLPGYAQLAQYKIREIVPGEKIVVTDMGYTLPMGQLTALGVNMIGAANSAWEGDLTEAERATKMAMYQLMSDYIAPEPLAESLVDAFKGTGDFGIPLETFGERAGHVAKVALPGSQAWKSVTRLFPEDPNDPRRQDIRDFAVGERPITIDIPKAYTSGLWPVALALKDTASAGRKLIQSAVKENMSEAEFAEKYMAIEEERKELMRFVEHHNRSGEALGLSKYERRKLLTASNLLGSNMISKSAYISGDWRPLRYPIKNVRIKGHDARDSEYNKYLRAMTRVQRDNDWR